MYISNWRNGADSDGSDYLTFCSDADSDDSDDILLLRLQLKKILPKMIPFDTVFIFDTVFYNLPELKVEKPSLSSLTSLSLI